MIINKGLKSHNGSILVTVSSSFNSDNNNNN